VKPCPCRKLENQPPRQVNAKASPSNRILVVDDDLSIRELNTQVLARSGYEVDAVEDGAAAWEALQANSYNLLITDNSMPKVSGVELIKMVRSARMTLPVILSSGITPTEELDRNPSLQLAAMLPKPIVIDELLHTVNEVLRAVEGNRSRTEIELG
jgi:DNA-binding response OmpR family regulator